MITEKPKETQLYRGLPESGSKSLRFATRPRSAYNRIVYKARLLVWGGIFLNGSLATMNLIFFLFFGLHWYSLAAAIVCGVAALYFCKKLDNSDLQYEDD